MSSASFGRDPTTVSDPVLTHLIVWVGFPVLGGVAGWVLSSVADWVAGLPWAPFQGPFELIAEHTGPLTTLLLVVAGVIAGFVVSLSAYGEMLKVVVTDTGVTLTRDNTSRQLERRAVTGAFVDGKELVLLGAAGDELAREKSDLEKADLESAFTAHGYPWHSADPHASAFSRWVEGAAGLPRGADALFKARQHALDEDNAHDIAELRDELAKIGVVVRDEKKRQYWRSTDPGSAG